MRSRPEVELRMSRAVHPGDAVLVELALRSRSPTPVELVELRLDGSYAPRLDGSYAMHHDGRGGAPRRFLSLVARVAEGITLEEGERRFRASFPLPDDAPCSYLGARAEIRYSIKLTVSIPWWLDVEESYELVVAPRPVARPPRAPIASTSARGEEPFVELSLDDRAFAPGDEITGAVALGNVQGRKVRGIELSLVGYERVRLASEAHRFTAFLRADGRDEGRELPFRFRIPAAAPPAFDAGWAALFWSFEARVDLARANDIVHRTPIALAAFDRPPELGGMRRQIGAGRWRAVWEAVGAQHGLSLDRHELRLTGALSGCAAAVWVDAGAAQPSSALVGELRWPSWGIGLQIGLKRFMLPLSAGDEEGFGNRYRVRGRDPAQVRAVVAAPLRRALLAFDEVRLDDERVTVTSRTPGHDQPWLGEFLGRLARLGAEIAAASARIPPPASMASARPAWEAFARELHGRLELGPMSIRDGRQDGATFHVETRYERAAEPDRTEITLALDPPLDAAPELDDPEALAAASPAVRELVRELRGPGGAARLTGDGPPERPRALRVTAGAVVLALPAPLEDPSITREVMGTMLLLSQRLRGARGAGPYR